MVGRMIVFVCVIQGPLLEHQSLGSKAAAGKGLQEGFHEAVVGTFLDLCEKHVDVDGDVAVSNDTIRQRCVGF